MNEIEIYKDKDNQTQIEVKFEEETVWLKQAQLAELFKGSRANIVEPIKNIYKTGELEEVFHQATFFVFILQPMPLPNLPTRAFLYDSFSKLFLTHPAFCGRRLV
ncbi:hypothetical protein [Ferruginibacter sp.]|uniref:hypothetical protein n=1 Tax=Ferruginibacter sp. TaxID=1940288 RepID=UPI00265981EF|nr:hypothetical protein [Ferruginibacter sp.]